MTLDERPKVLILINHYVPAYRAGGPIRSVESLVESNSDRFAFKIITQDRDFRSNKVLAGITPGQWQKIGSADVYFLSRARTNPFFIAQLINRTPYDLMYLQTWYHPVFSLVPMVLRRLRLIAEKPTLQAPRGEFSAGAMGKSRAKKIAYNAVARYAGLANGTLFQATNPEEGDQIRSILGQHIETIMAPNLPAVVRSPNGCARPQKKPGEASFVFLSRIEPHKNLITALRLLSDVRGRVRYTIFGPIDDAAYWQQCKNLIPTLPGNIEVDYAGPVGREEVAERLRQHHFLFFPTKGENFGHVIYESLALGLPTIISDQTPWCEISQIGAGWTIPLEDQATYVSTIEACVAMDDAEYRRRSEAARAHAREYTNLAQAEQQTSRMLNHALSRQMST